MPVTIDAADATAFNVDGTVGLVTIKTAGELVITIGDNAVVNKIMGTTNTGASVSVTITGNGGLTTKNFYETAGTSGTAAAEQNDLAKRFTWTEDVYVTTDSPVAAWVAGDDAP